MTTALNGSAPVVTPASEDELPLEMRVAILKKERELIRAQRTRLEIRHRIQTRLKGKEALQEIEAELIRCEEALQETVQIAEEWGVLGALTE